MIKILKIGVGKDTQKFCYLTEQSCLWNPILLTIDEKLFFINPPCTDSTKPSLEKKFM
jgi:hypothetical protein